ncbi:MAG: kdpD [Haloplasmataceae bacterium]|jgi:two-component system sensor histidine kinase KdpD|nr:kdpD [Haloplasmataceae bacterium]
MLSDDIKEHILVCLNSAPSNEKVVRSAIKLANKKNARLTALYVETQYTDKLDKVSKKLLNNNVKIAEEAGANIVTTYGDDIAYQISEYAKVSYITTIIIGHTNEGRYLKRPKRLVDKILNYLPDVEIYIIPNKSVTESKSYKSYPKHHYKINKKDILFTLLIILICTLSGFIIEKLLNFNEVNIVFFYILGVLLISTQTNGKIYGIVGSIFGALIYTFLFSEPKNSFQIAKIDNTITLIIMLIVAIVTSTLTTQVKLQANKAVTNSYRTSILFELNQAINLANNLEDMIHVAQKQIYKLIQTSFKFYLLNDNGSILLAYLCNDSINKLNYFEINENNQINQVLESKVKLDINNGSFIPLYSEKGIVSIIYISEINNLDREQKSLLTAMINQVAIAVERFKLNEAKNQALIQFENERYRLNMFRALSHDLRTPLTGITGSAKSILSNKFTENTVNDLVSEIYDDSIWLTNMVENLLFLSKLENEKIVINKEPQLVDEIIDEALKHIHKQDTNKELYVDKIDNLLMVNADVQLIVQVIINLVNNAIYHSNSGKKICISASSIQDFVLFSISDDGDGISDENKQHMFEMFFSLDKKRRGLGLGLALCKMIVEAHNGTIITEDNIPKGTVFKFTIPRVEVTINEQLDFNS